MADMTYTGLGNSYTTNGITPDWRLDSGTSRIGIPSDQESQKGRWVYEVYPICDVCGASDPNCITMPYGSRHDGENICTSCIKELIDPVLDKEVSMTDVIDTLEAICESANLTTERIESPPHSQMAIIIHIGDRNITIGEDWQVLGIGGHG